MAESGVLPLVPKASRPQSVCTLHYRSGGGQSGCADGRLGWTDWVEVMVV